MIGYKEEDEDEEEEEEEVEEIDVTERYKELMNVLDMPPPWSPKLRIDRN
eukprot:CAMPEP_0201282426 /NCGR_PEP_ID=MMETSP1317-20130820/5622_1 /ASSEMBLY_ACC=CAM_ASM_000770 /TAXON_ID=187299 /ORGANISM="Undescribed Undescribed, Strain Undescribed" /LENGTH=49 /DNA_ID=CAMNT_0047595039 /DNA_START=241 /DNA_END=390 /DNA_ORIENTATION=+